MEEKHNFKKVKYSSLTSMYLSANGFYTNYKTLKKGEADRIGKPQCDDLLSVAATSGFFAVELYLKWIYAVIYWEDNEKNKKIPENSTKFPTGHDIKKLFERLDSKSKEKIIKEFSDIMTEEKLLEELDKSKKGFIEWRYIFEKDSLEGNFDFLSKILTALFSICKYYIDLYYKPKEEWQTHNTRTSVIMHQEQVNSIDEAMSMSLKEVLKKEY